ncbi:hypothetical protein GWI33_019906 [Rhynchophorus ferrugineus]|uniref:MBD domain-containing protein n=1 Tax=Rhynchophorus ferrugineus TaxID=354439 RepID=A0A834HRR5_RHYFE|nr:hypothetical protein GWI33_019906 [Rhynchophorus ferrugineus]
MDNITPKQEIEIHDTPVKLEELETSSFDDTKTDAKDNDKSEPSQNGDSNEKSAESEESNDKTENAAKTQVPEAIDKPERVTRGLKRKVSHVEPTNSVQKAETTEQKENVDSKNSENVQDDSPSKDSMGKGKRARIPNKRYSDIAITPNRKSTSNQKQSDGSDQETPLKEDSVEPPVSITSPPLPYKKQRFSGVKENLQDSKFLKPFKFGWKRELVWRSTSTTLKPIGDIYYYTPHGKKIRSFRELADHLNGNSKNLTIENFSFTKEPLGLDDPEKEIIRDAKVKTVETASESSAAKKVESLKKPKRILSPKVVATESPKVETPPVKNKGVDTTAVSKNTPSASKKTKMPVKKNKSTPAKKAKTAIPKTDELMEVDPVPVRSTTSKTSKPCQPCSIRCEGLQGIIPTLQCSLCLCLYHHECVGVTENLPYPYVCKNCHSEHGENNEDTGAIVAPPPLTPINTLKSAPAGLSTALPKLQRIPRSDPTDLIPVLPSIPKCVSPSPTPPPPMSSASPLTKNEMAKTSQDNTAEGSKSLVGSVTTWLPHNVKLINSEEPTEAPRPQYLEYLGGRKFLVIPKHNFMSVSSTSSAPRSEETAATPSNPSIPPALQPTEIPASSASLGPDVPVNTPNSDDIHSVKDEPKSPTRPAKPGESPSSDNTMDIDINDNGGAESDPARINEDDVKDDVNNQNSVTKSTKQRNLKLRSITNSNTNNEDEENKFMENYFQNLSFGYNTLLYVFQYLKVQDLLRSGCVCTMWRDIASHPSLWRTVRMKNSQIHSFEGLANTLKKHGTVHLDLRKMLLPSNGDEIWPQFSRAIARVTTLKKIELCRCPASVVEKLAVTNPDLEVINAVTIKCDKMNLNPLNSLKCIKELRLKSTSGLTITSLDSLKELKTLTHLSLTSVNELHSLNLRVIAELKNLESLDLGECTDFSMDFGRTVLCRLDSLEKLRLEKGQGNCCIFEILEAVRHMKSLEQLELVNFDVKAGFDKALGACTNIKKLMIIPTYISQSATTNNMVLAGVLRLKRSLTHFVWGVTLELLRVTELFVDQCEEPKDKKDKKPAGNGDSIPVLKPVPDLSHDEVIQTASNPPQVEILPLPNLQKLLLNSLPTTRVKILKIPFHATWRQTLTDSV